MTAKTLTYRPAKPGCRTLAEAEANPMTVQGLRVTANVTGTAYTVFAGGVIIAEGELDGTEGCLNTFFCAEATVWDAGVDADRQAQADADIAAYEAEVTAVQPEPEPEPETALQRVRGTLGKGSWFRAPSGSTIPPADMGLALLLADRRAMATAIVEYPDGHWAVDIFNTDGSLYGRFHYCG